jgi:hypothetical protein
MVSANMVKQSEFSDVFLGMGMLAIFGIEFWI